MATTRRAFPQLASLFKRFSILEKLNSEFRFEAFTFLNHPLPADPVTNPRSSDFGFMTSKTLVSSQANVSTNERDIQLGLKFIF